MQQPRQERELSYHEGMDLLPEDDPTKLKYMISKSKNKYLKKMQRIASNPGSFAIPNKAENLTLARPGEEAGDAYR